MSTWIYNQKIEDKKVRKRKEDEDAREKEEYLTNLTRDKMRKLINTYNEEKERKQDTNKWDNALLEYSKIALNIKSLDELPSFITQPSDIDALYSIDGRIVRLYIYEHFVLKRANISTLKESAFGAKSVIKFLKNFKKLYINSFIHDGYKLYNTEYNCEPENINLEMDIPNFNSVKIISNYLYLLTQEGVLKYVGNYFYKLPNLNKHEVI